MERMWASCGRDRHRFQHEQRCQTGSFGDENNVAMEKKSLVGHILKWECRKVPAETGSEFILEPKG